ncbi:helix-turn-helix transcriptional regulator [Anaerovorax sp. IOR16]|uniref:helix-turn-helix transcriptional regulator n=1 Tax=Anaerovorax sp. IOR16 TaxID=2773458 RepID=UPI0019CF8762|nr:helix-turn-helix transcriptional regulator [Anaerovorax sp. IOR16]
MNQQFAEKISKLRKNKGMTQQELAEKLGVTNKAVSRWETGEGYPEVTLLAPLADSLGVTVDYLFKTESPKCMNSDGESQFNEDSVLKNKSASNHWKEKLVWADFLSYALPLFSLLLFVLLLCIPGLGRGLSFLLFLLFWGLSLYFRKNFYWRLKEENKDGTKTSAWCKWYKVVCAVSFFPIHAVVNSWFVAWIIQHVGMDFFNPFGDNNDESLTRVRFYLTITVIGVSLFLTVITYIVGIWFVTGNERDVNQPIRTLLWLYYPLNELKNTQRLSLFLFNSTSVLLFLLFFYFTLDLNRMEFIKNNAIILSNQIWFFFAILIIYCIYAAASICFMGVLNRNIPRTYIIRNNVILLLLSLGFYFSGKSVFVVTSTGRVVDPNAVINWDVVSPTIQLDEKIFAIFILTVFFVYIFFNRQARKSL